MTDIVPADEIEIVVGARRHTTLHLGRLVSVNGVVYILHSQECLDSGIDLRDCEYSLALDYGDVLHPDMVLQLFIYNDYLLGGGYTDE